MLKLLFFLFVFAGCQTAQQKSVLLVEDRVEKLKPLSSWKPTWCQVETQLTQPALARYQQMFPLEKEKLASSSWSYTWKSRESTCEITPLDASPVTENHQAFLETSLCLLMQVHYVNSPFDELAMLTHMIATRDDDRVHVKAGENPDLGIFMPSDKFVVETHTKSRGVLVAEYDNKTGPWLPKSLEQRHAGTVFRVEDIRYEGNGPRPMLKSYWISVGGEQPLRHSQVMLNSCRDL